MAKTKEISLKDDPRTIRDPALWNRLKLLIEHEALDRAWGCPLYILHRKGWLTLEQREAGDKYQSIILDERAIMETDPEEGLPESRELAYKRIEKRKEARRACLNVLGLYCHTVNRLVLDELYPRHERERVLVREGLQLLANYFFPDRNKRRTAS